jgi:hypothetical protein
LFWAKKVRRNSATIYVMRDQGYGGLPGRAVGAEGASVPACASGNWISRPARWRSPSSRNCLNAEAKGGPRNVSNACRQMASVSDRSRDLLGIGRTLSASVRQHAAPYCAS